jgi:bifunctional UDP-N-acetylglucosamine pyrophosphorylase/glucosamine-1-phosphate N-acetyltransferase
MRVFGIVLAAGQGKRMKSDLYKVLHPVCGKPMVGHVVDSLGETDVQRIVVVVGHGAEAVEKYLGNRVEYAVQDVQLGTGHAVMQADPFLSDEDGLTVVLYGDTPLITSDTIKKLFEHHKQSGAAAAVLTTEMPDPYGYGRIIRSDSGEVEKVVEQKDCTPEEREIKEVNTGICCYDNRKLFEALKKVKNDNAQREYYLTDVIGILREDGGEIEAFRLDDWTETVGVNDREALSEAEKWMRRRINRQHMLSGVTIIDPSATYIDAGVNIGTDTVIFPGTMISGNTTIGNGCEIGPHSRITNCRIGDKVHVMESVLSEAQIHDRTSVGPFAYLRPGSRIGSDCKVGDFVEIKNSTLGDGSKVSHLSYVGDAKVGKNVNIGCGAITVNYDGYQKHVTEIEDEAFIGSNVNLIAPVSIGKRAYVVAGSTITNDVEEDALAIARERQTTKPGYAERLRKRIKNKKSE